METDQGTIKMTRIIAGTLILLSCATFTGCNYARQTAFEHTQPIKLACIEAGMEWERGKSGGSCVKEVDD